MASSGLEIDGARFLFLGAAIEMGRLLVVCFLLARALVFGHCEESWVLTGFSLQESIAFSLGR